MEHQPLQNHIRSYPERHYMAISTKLRMADLPVLLPPLIPELESWLQERGAHLNGPAFFHYTDWDGELLTVEVGVTIEKPVAGNDRIKAKVFPAGAYAIAFHKGPYTQLPAAHAAAERWVQAEGYTLYGTRTEFYLTDPAEVPDAENWITRLEFLLEEVPVSQL